MPLQSDASVGHQRFWSPNYTQHSAHIPPGRDGLFNLFSGNGRPHNWIAADLLIVQDGILMEHWDGLQDEASREESLSGRPMFGASFPNYDTPPPAPQTPIGRMASVRIIASHTL